jgi:hypothetical protein
MAPWQDWNQWIWGVQWYRISFCWVFWGIFYNQVSFPCTSRLHWVNIIVEEPLEATLILVYTLLLSCSCTPLPPFPRLTFWYSTCSLFVKLIFPCSRELGHAGEEESVVLEGDIGGGLVLQRQIYFPKNAANIIRINSSIIAHSVGAGSGGFSRFYLKLFLYIIISLISHLW